MPVLPFALRAIYNQTKDVTLLKEFVPKLVRYFDWWRQTRDADGDYIVSIFHGWESGLDASPIYDLAYGIPPSTPHPPFLDLYPRFTELLIFYKWVYGWNQTDILNLKHKVPILDGYFVVQDVGVNSVYAAGWGVLADLASQFDTDLAQQCKNIQMVTEKAIIDKLWDNNLKRFVSTYKDKNGKTVAVDYETVQSLFPLLLESLPEEYQQSIVNTQLRNASKFWLQYPIPSTSASAAQFTPVFTTDLMWRGPTWPIQNWLVMEGLHKHNVFGDTINELMDKWIALYEKSGIWEQYNPITGENYGVEGLAMSTLIVDWLYRLGRV
jgi:glycogen debranching enzyme